MSDTGPVKFDHIVTKDDNLLAVATLDSERSLNALTLEMVELLLPRLAEWAADERVVAVLLRGRGDRAFCAGGDVRRLTEAARTGEGDAGHAAEFFAREYRLDYAIHRFPKPLLVWGTGVVMGGGMGLFAGAGFRVVTDTTRMAMPEITIGLYPDVGGSYFLSRLPDRLGLFLGLGAQQFGAADALRLGLATHALPASSWDALLQRLAASSWRDDARETLDGALRALALPPLPPGPLELHEAGIDALCAHGDLAALDAAWRAEAPADPWLAKAVGNYRAGSPTSAALIWRQWQASATQSLAEVFRTEWVVSTQCAGHADFPEGVRALLIDKDQSPRWQPALLAAVDAAHVDAHYRLPAGVAAHPLADLEQVYGA